MERDLRKVAIMMQDGQIVKQGILSNQAIVGFPNRHAFFPEGAIQLGGFDSSLYRVEPKNYTGKQVLTYPGELSIFPNTLQCFL
jgi:hypothetical protein